MTKTNRKRNSAMAKSYRQKERQAYLMIAPQLIGFFVFSIYPILWVFRYAFYDYDGITATFVGLENFVRAFTRDSSYWLSVLNTIVIAYGKLIIEIPLALITAIVVCSKLIKCKKLFSVIYYLPSVTGVAVSCLIFSFMFATVNGTVNNGLMAIGMLDAPVSWFSEKWTAMTVIIIRSIWAGFAANLLYFMAGIQNISEDVLEAAKIDGTNRFQEFIYVTIPMLAPVIRVILMLAMVEGMKIMNDVMLLTNGGPGNSTNVVMLQIYKMYFEPEGVPQYGYASALGVITTFIIGILTIIYLKISKKADSVY